MLYGQTPKWLQTLERRFGWIAIPNIAVLLVTLQVLGFLMFYANPAWLSKLALVPRLVFEGEIWRLLTFLALPVSLSPLWMLFALWFLYFILNLIENEWGAFKTTLYILVSIIVTIVFSFMFDYPVAQVSHFTSTLFLAAAALYPNLEVHLFMILPVKLKWLGWLTLGFVALQLVNGTWTDRLYLLAIYSNYMLFFGPAALDKLRQFRRRQKFKRTL